MRSDPGREMPATEASRNFSAVLDAAARGETILVTRAGTPIAAITPAPRANGGTLSDLFDRYASAPVPGGDELADHVGALPDVARTDLDSDPWRD